MFKIDVLGTFQGRQYADITLGRNSDVLGTSLQNLWDILVDTKTSLQPCCDVAIQSRSDVAT